MKNNIYITVNTSHSNTGLYYIYYIDFVENIKQSDINDDKFIPCWSISLNVLFEKVFTSFLLKNKIVKQIKKQILYYEM